MKKVFIFMLILLTSISFFGCSSSDKGAEIQQQEQSQERNQENNGDDKAIRELVEGFGGSLQKVSLQAPKDILEKSMQENYGKFVAPELLEQWLSDPLNAPGTLTSSPWPERIEVLSSKKISEDSYEVKGEVIEITSAEKASGGVAARRPITLGVKKLDGKWLINSANLGDYEE